MNDQRRVAIETSCTTNRHKISPILPTKIPRSETYSPETESIEVSNEIDRITLFPTARRVSACGKLDLQDLSRRPLYRVFFP